MRECGALPAEKAPHPARPHLIPARLNPDLFQPGAYRGQEWVSKNAGWYELIADRGLHHPRAEAAAGRRLLDRRAAALGPARP
jgi:hypothetical protein